MSLPLSQRTRLVMWCLGRRMCYLVRSYLVVCHVLVPSSLPAVACVLSDPIAPCSWSCISTFRCLVIMRMCVRLHGTLYPMTDCVLYLGRTIVLAVQPGSADVPQASLRFYCY